MFVHGSSEVSGRENKQNAARPTVRTAPTMSVEVTRHGQFTVVTFNGTLCRATALEAEAQLLSTIVLAGRPLQLILDLAHVEISDAAGLELIAKTRFAIHASRGCSLLVIVPEDCQARHVLMATSVGRDLDHVPSLAHALAAPDFAAEA